MALFLSFRYQSVGGGLRPTPRCYQSDTQFKLNLLSLADIREFARGRDVVFAIHGYNNHQNEGVCALSRFELALSLPSSMVFVGILWPGDSRAGFISYPVEKPTASQTGRYLASVCNSDLADCRSFSFVSHSLGARVALEAIRAINGNVRCACLMAAAIERSCLEKEYSDAFAKADIVSVLASRKDNVLRYAFPGGNLIGDILDPTANPLSSALGYSGPERAIGQTSPPWQIDNSANYDHGDYLPPSDAADQFPLAGAKWVETAAFANRALLGQPQTWPVIPAPTPPHRGWWVR